MATYTTSDLQEAAITLRRGVVNQQREKDRLPLLADNAAYVAYLLDDAMKTYIESKVQQFADKYRGATDSQRAAVDAALEKL